MPNKGLSDSNFYWRKALFMFDGEVERAHKVE
jgi:hypothetical protein